MTDLRDDYEAVERAVCEAVPLDLAHVPDDEEQRYDARLESAAHPSPPIMASAAAGTPVEIKTCQHQKASGKPGQWIFHRAPHDYLEAFDGVYLLAVLREYDIVDWVFVRPGVLGPYWTWYDVSTPGYEQQADIRWPVILGEIEWQGTRRLGRVPATDGGESA
jgi:hypothetical protein